MKDMIVKGFVEGIGFGLAFELLDQIVKFMGLTP